MTTVHEVLRAMERAPRDHNTGLKQDGEGLYVSNNRHERLPVLWVPAMDLKLKGTTFQTAGGHARMRLTRDGVDIGMAGV